MSVFLARNVGGELLATLCQFILMRRLSFLPIG